MEKCSLDGGRPSSFFPVSCRCPTVRSQTAVTLTEVDRMTWEHTHTHTHAHSHTNTLPGSERERIPLIPSYKFNWPTCQERKRKYTGLWTSLYMPSGPLKMSSSLAVSLVSFLHCVHQRRDVWHRAPRCLSAYLRTV